jgi:hypothetical protein
MLISHSKKFIFIHVPKTGGTSIMYALWDYACTPDSVGAGRPTALNSPCSDQFDKHVTTAELKAQLPRKIFRGYFKFMFVRNPWDLAVSYYHFYSQNKEHRLYEAVSQFKSFEEYLEWRAGFGVRQQNHYCCDSDGGMLVDFVGRYETLDRDFKKVCGLIGVLPTKLPRLNSSKHDDYRTYYNTKTKKLIKATYLEDIKLFGYKF